jgi:hypothetical protein
LICAGGGVERVVARAPLDHHADLHGDEPTVTVAAICLRYST